MVNVVFGDLYIVPCQAHPVLVKKANQMCGSFLFKFLSRWLSGPPVDGPKDPWPRVLSLPERFVGDPASLARDNIYKSHWYLILNDIADMICPLQMGGAVATLFKFE